MRIRTRLFNLVLILGLLFGALGSSPRRRQLLPLLIYSYLNISKVAVLIKRSRSSMVLEHP